MEFRLLKADEISCRVSQIDKSWCTLLLFKDARVDMDILDETVGSMNWQRTHEVINGNLFCNIEIWDNEKNQWVKKQDVGTESQTEKEKGEASDSFKRAGTNVGIGRELYTAPTIFITPRKDMGSVRKPDDEPNEFFLGKNEKYTTKTRFYVDYIDYEDRKIKNLMIRDHKGNVRFEQLTPEKEKEINKQFEELRKLIQTNEEKDDKFDRAEFYKYFKVESDNQLNLSQREKAIELLKKRLKKVD